MNDIMKSKTRKEASAKMTLDTALKTIEEADSLIKEARSGLDISYRGKLEDVDDLFVPVVQKVGISTGVGTVAGIFVMASLGIDMNAVFTIPIAGIMVFAGFLTAPHTMSKLLVRKKYKEFQSNIVEDKLFMAMAFEEFHHKEKAILKDCKQAWDFANKEFEDHGCEIVYVSERGFKIESAESLETNQWDALRLKAIREKGSKAIGIRPKVKELTA